MLNIFNFSRNRKLPSGHLPPVYFFCSYPGFQFCTLARVRVRSFCSTKRSFVNLVRVFLMRRNRSIEMWWERLSKCVVPLKMARKIAIVENLASIKATKREKRVLQHVGRVLSILRRENRTRKRGDYESDWRHVQSQLHVSSSKTHFWV